jgi:hypothetical protein
MNYQDQYRCHLSLNPGDKLMNLEYGTNLFNNLSDNKLLKLNIIINEVILLINKVIFTDKY